MMGGLDIAARRCDDPSRSEHAKASISRFRIAATDADDAPSRQIVLQRWGFPCLLLAPHGGTLTRLAPTDFPIRPPGVSVDKCETLSAVATAVGGRSTMQTGPVGRT